MTVFGDGTQTRSFCYVDDLIRGLVLLAESDVHEPVNIGNPNEMSLLEMAKLIIELTESRSEVVFEALPVDDPQVRQPDIARARDLLGWEPEIDVREGIRRTIEHYTKILGAARVAMSSAEAKNLEAISKAIDHHNGSCEWPAVAIEMNPFEVERLGWDSIRGLPIRPNPIARDGVVPRGLRPRGRAAGRGGDGRGGRRPDRSRRVDAGSLNLDECPDSFRVWTVVSSRTCRYIPSSRNRRPRAGKGSVSTSRAFVTWL